MKTASNCSTAVLFFTSSANAFVVLRDSAAITANAIILCTTFFLIISNPPSYNKCSNYPILITYNLIFCLFLKGFSLTTFFIKKNMNSTCLIFPLLVYYFCHISSLTIYCNNFFFSVFCFNNLPYGYLILRSAGA